MIRLNYRLAPPPAPPTVDLGGKPADDASISGRALLHYGFMCGDTEYVVNGVDFSAAWGWVPIVGFAAELHDLLVTGPETGSARFEFTENDEVIEYAFAGRTVAVSASYAEGTAEVSRAELTAAATLFVLQVLKDAATAHPWVADLAEYRRILAKAMV